MSSGRYNLKQTTYLLAWPKPGTLTTPSAAEDVEQQQLSFTSGGHAVQGSHSGRPFGIFLQN